MPSKRFWKGSNPATSDQRHMAVGLDANLIGFKHISNKSTFDPHEAVAHIAEAMSSVIIDVHIVCDNDSKRPPSKRASCECKANVEKTSIHLLAARSRLQDLLNSQGASQSSLTQIAKMQKKIHGMEKEVKKLLPLDFAKKLKAFIDGYSSEGKGDITYEMAPFQVDPCPAKLAVDGKIDAIGSGNSDFIMYVGPKGENNCGTDMMLKDFVLTVKKEPIKSCRIVMGQLLYHRAEWVTVGGTLE